MESLGTGQRSTALIALIGLFALVAAGAATSAEARKPWQPVYAKPNPHHLKRSALRGSVGPHGGTVRCHGKPLLVDPGHSPPARRGQYLRVIRAGGGNGTGPDSVARCGRRGKFAWYLSTRDPLLKKRFRGPRKFSLPAGRMKTTDFDRGGYVVGTGGCYPREGGIQPPCTPDIPQEVELPAFRVYPGARITVSAVIGLTSTELTGNHGGDASVEVQMTVDAVAVGRKAEAVLNGDVAIKVPLKTSSRINRGRHVVGVRVTGRGFNYVNVRADSATLKATASRRMG